MYTYILRGFKTSDDAFRLSYSIAFDCSIHPFLDLFHSWLYTYIPSFQVLRGRPRFFLPSGFQWTIISGSRVGSFLSTWPYQISCFFVMSRVTFIWLINNILFAATYIRCGPTIDILILGKDFFYVDVNFLSYSS